MALINTVDYNVYLDLNDELNFSFNLITDSHFDHLSEYLKNLNISNNNSVIVLWGAPHRIYLNADYMLELNEFYHSIKNPLILFTGILDIQKPEYIDFHCQGINYFQYVTKLYQPLDREIKTLKSKKFLYMSTKDFISRRYLLQHILKNNFEYQGVIAYKCLATETFNENYKHRKEEILNAGKTIEARLPIKGFDDEPNHNAVPNTIINDTYLSIITETYFEGPMYFSEKIYYAMSYNHFFIYLGPPHSLKYLKSLGFKTFGHIIDESYDDIEDTAERLLAVTKSLDSFLRLSIKEIEQMYVDNLGIINHNKQLVGSIDINDIVNDGIRLAKTLRL